MEKQIIAIPCFCQRPNRPPIRQGESPPPPRRIQIDAAEYQRQAGGLDLQAAMVHPVGRELESSRFQPLLPDRVTVPVPVKDLQAIPRLAPEDEPGSRQRVMTQLVPDQLGQRVETLPHVHRIQADKDLGRGVVQHVPPPFRVRNRLESNDPS